MDAWTFLRERARSSWLQCGGPGRVVAAVSGGADSAALLLALADLRGELGFSLSAAHVDHGLRPASFEDAAFAQAFCQSAGVPCRVCRVQVPGASEDAARQARYEALEDACRQFGADALALAHHRRDQMETVLLHLFRGSGSGGLGAMEEWSLRVQSDGGQTALWRPFLSVPPGLIRDALREKGVRWAEDETNGQDVFQRNYLRHRVLPAVSLRFPQAEEAVARTARIMADENRYFTQEALAFLSRDACLLPPCRWVRYGALRALHPALRRYALRLACPVETDARTTEALMALAPGGKMNLPRDWRAECSREYLHFLPPEMDDPPAAGPLRVLPGNGQTGDGKRMQAMRPALPEQCEMRFRRPGDVIQPLGAKGSKSLQDYFVDKKVPRPFRPYVPLLCRGSRVIWALGVGPGEEARVFPGDEAVLLRYDGFLPGDAPEHHQHTEGETV